MKIKYILSAAFIALFSVQSVFADVVSEISVKYSAILDRYETELSTEKFQDFITKIDDRIEDRLEAPDVSELRRLLYVALKTENAKRKTDPDRQETINAILRNSFNSNQNTTTSTSSSDITQDKASLFRDQSIIENTIRVDLQNEL